MRNVMGNETHQVPCPHGAFILMPRLCFKINGFKFLATVYRWHARELCRVRCSSWFTPGAGPHVPSGEAPGAWWEYSVWKEYQGYSSQTAAWPETLFTSLARTQFLMPGPPRLSLFNLVFFLFSSCPCWGRSLPITLCLVLLFLDLMRTGFLPSQYTLGRRKLQIHFISSTYLEMMYCLSAVRSILSLVGIVVGCRSASSKSRSLGLQFLHFTFPSCKFKKQRARGWILLLFILKVSALHMQVHAMVLAFSKSSKKALWTKPQRFARKEIVWDEFVLEPLNVYHH